MTFEPKTYPVNLSGETDPTKRAQRIAEQIGAATEKLNRRPTHVLADKTLRLDIETLDAARLRVRRIRWPSHFEVRLAVEMAEVSRSAGGPARIPVQARLV